MKILDKLLGVFKRTPVLESTPEEFREALACHAIFMAFGIPVDDIWVSYVWSSTSGILQVVAKQNGLEFRVDIAEMKLDKSSFAKKWQKTISAYNAATTDKRMALTEGTRAIDGAVYLIAAMVAKGFDPVDRRIQA